MTQALPRTQHGAVLAGVKAKPSGWPTASPDTGSGRRRSATSASDPRTKIHQFHVSTVSGDCREAAQLAERVGFEAVFLPDHILPLDILQEDKQGRVGQTSEQAVEHGPSDAWTFLAGLARETSTIRLGTLVTCSMFRPPAMLAIQVGNINQMSGGRIDLGIGAGWLEVEHTAYGLAFPPIKTRFEMLEEQLAIFRGLWDTPADQTFSFKGSTTNCRTRRPSPTRTSHGRGSSSVAAGSRRHPASV